MNDFFDNQRLLEVIWKHRFHFVIVGIIAVILSAFFSSPMFITPKYKSTTKAYPTNLGVMSEESYTEQMLEIINSTDIKLKMFDAFELDKVYKISKDDPKYLTYMLAIYDKHVSTRKTDFETVQITILDKKPERAALMCDSLIHFYNQKVQEMHSEKNWELAKVIKDNIARQTTEQDSLRHLLVNFRDTSRLYDVVLQTPEVTRGYMRSMVEGSSSMQNEKEIKRIYNNLLENGADVHIMERRFESLVVSINELKVEYDKAISEAEKRITYAMVVEKPLVADDKSYPVRWVIVAFTLISSLFLALLVLLILDYKKK
ncbi:MAG TPA: Wzz/FepE/Etk N-terminal domain-containing protein [Prolixibacteraceae bacterium]|nr:Wzz/FepE/Etk N-terminal domain-containing protein [Prolixibacteraceae bacterium]HOS00751.1 Wzz/FepE/Etk N-terminal domain-containing protein [Prolixibacteraceae bacterium]HPL44904.1 Wzz/FepE/Etk N-terminal domain-containing protein [Prolixibacteraceae bacterium]HQJ85649.1 Wzz/FepE/Etk N-terminal domain-containing protein [Prolixibacteraceae bacterium]